MGYDLVIHGGTVIDPASGVHDRRDVAIAGGRIAAVEPHIGLGDTADAIDATDRYVVPGLVDLHVHVYWGVADLSIRPGPSDLARGATTIVDAGSAGANTYPGFREYVIDPFVGRILAFVNISATGQIDPFLGELHDLRYLIADRAADCVRGDRDRVVGIKVRLSEELTGPNAIPALDRADRGGRRRRRAGHGATSATRPPRPTRSCPGCGPATSSPTRSPIAATGSSTTRGASIPRRSRRDSGASCSISATARARSRSGGARPRSPTASGPTRSAPTSIASTWMGRSTTS